MRISHKNYIHTYYHDNSLNRKHKKPNEIVQSLNNDINTIQTAVKYYNKSFQASNKLRKKIDLAQSRTYPLKTLSEPKFQNILLGSNFNENPLFLGSHKPNNQSFLRRGDLENSVKKINYSRKSSLYQNNRLLDDNISYKKICNNEIEKENPQQIQSLYRKIDRKVSFDQQIGKFNKLVYMNTKSGKANYSDARFRAFTNIYHHKNEQNINQNDEFMTNTIINGSSVSRFMQTSRIDNFNDDIVKQFADERELGNQQNKRIQNTRNLRKIIGEKGEQLKKQWLKTQNYQQKIQFISNQTQKQPLKYPQYKKANKLQKILRKVNNNRPTTSMSTQRKIPQNTSNPTLADSNVFQGIHETLRIQL